MHTHEQLNTIIDVMYSKLELSLTSSFNMHSTAEIFIHLILFIYFIIIILKGNENSKVCKFKNTSSKTCNGIPHYQYSNKTNKSTIGNINSNRNTLLNQ
jgi:hypothetical protein